MNWTRTVLAGVVGGVVANLVDFVNHGMILGGTYAKYPEVFTQESANPAWFFLISISIAIFAAALFGKTRAAWTNGWKGAPPTGSGWAWSSSSSRSTAPW